MNVFILFLLVLSSLLYNNLGMASNWASRSNELLLKSERSPTVCLSMWNDFLKDQSPTAWVSFASVLVLKNTAGEVPCRETLFPLIQSKVPSTLLSKQDVPVDINELLLGLIIAPEKINHHLVPLMPSAQFWQNFFPEINPRQALSLTMMFCEKIAASIFYSSSDPSEKLKTMISENPNLENSLFRSCYQELLNERTFSRFKK